MVFIFNCLAVFILCTFHSSHSSQPSWPSAPPSCSFGLSSFFLLLRQLGGLSSGQGLRLFLSVR